MKKQITFLTLLLLVGGIVFFSSCTKTSGGTDPVVPTGLADGWYVVGSASNATANATFGLVDAYTDKETKLAGLQTAYMYLKAGDLKLAKYVDNAETLYGGTAVATSFTGADTATFGPVGYSGDPINAVHGTYSADGGNISITEAGLYMVFLYEKTSTFYFIKVSGWEIIGSATADGWSTGQALALDKNTESVVSYSASGIVLRTGKYKFRFPGLWTLTPYKDGVLLDADLGLQTNLGSLTDGGSEFSEGGYDIAAPDDIPGTYKVTLTFTAGKGRGVSTSFERTGDAPTTTFNPDENQWEIIGSSTELGTWAQNGGVGISLTHKDNNGTHTWEGVATLAPGDSFKFRVGDWVKTLDAQITWSGSAKDILSDDGTNDHNFKVADTATAGEYTFVLTTSDDGTTYTMTIEPK